MRPEYYLGIDTSNYTTSAAIIDGEGRVIANCKRPLPVAEGVCGLRQSDAVFAHIKNMPSLMQEVRSYLSGGELAAIGVSEAQGAKCPRCWMHTLSSHAEGLCKRCEGVVAKLDVEI